MANKKVSEMAEMQAAEVTADDLIYIVDTSNGTNGSKKISVQNLASSVMTMAGAIGFPDWSNDMSEYSQWHKSSSDSDIYRLQLGNGHPSTLTLPTNAFIYKWSDPDTTIPHLHLQIGNKKFEDSLADAIVLRNGVFVKSGTVIQSTAGSGIGVAFYLIPLRK